MDKINTFAAIAGILGLFISLLALMQAVFNYQIYLPGISQPQPLEGNSSELGSEPDEEELGAHSRSLEPAPGDDEGDHPLCGLEFAEEHGLCD